MQLGDMRSTRHNVQQADFSGAVTPITAKTPGNTNASSLTTNTHLIDKTQWCLLHCCSSI